MNVSGTNIAKSRSTTTYALGIFAVALALRLGFLLYFSGSPLFGTPVMDMSYFHRWGLALAAGEPFGEGPYFKAPFYAIFLSMVYQLFGSGDWAVRIVQSVLGSLTAVLAFFIGTRVFDRTVGLVAGLLVASAATLIALDAQILVPSLFIFLSVLGLYFLVVAIQGSAGRGTGPWYWWFMSGAALGLAAITRPTVLVFVAILIVYLLWLAFRRAGEIPRSAFLLLALGTAVSIAPVTVRNYAASGEFVPIGTYAGVNLYIGNNVTADGVTTYLPGTGLDWWGDGAMPEAKMIAEVDAGRPLSATEHSAYWRDRAIAEMVQHPDVFAGLVLRKFTLLLAGYELANNFDVYYIWRDALLLRPLLIGFPVYYPWGILLPLALIGLVLLRSWRLEHKVLVLFVVASALPLLLFFVTGRYRLPILPVLAIFAAVALVRGIGLWRRASRRRAVTAVVIVIAVLVVSRIDFYGLSRASEAQGHQMMASIHRQNGDVAKAELFYRKALAADSTFPHANNDLGLLLLQRQRYDDAIRLFRRAVRSQPEDYLLHYNLGVAHLNAGNIDSAITRFHRVLRIVPGHFDAANNLGRAWLLEGQLDSALVAYRTAAGAAPELPHGYYAVGYCHDQLGRTDSARVYYRKTLQRDADFTRAYFGLGMAWRGEDRPDSVRYYLQQYLERSPGIPDLDARAESVLDSLRQN